MLTFLIENLSDLCLMKLFTYSAKGTVEIIFSFLSQPSENLGAFILLFTLGVTSAQVQAWAFNAVKVINEDVLICMTPLLRFPVQVV